MALLPDHPRCLSPGAASAAAFGVATGRSACLANGGRVAGLILSCDLFQVEDDASERYWLFAPATARTPPRARTAGSFTGSSDERAPLRRASGHFAVSGFLRGLVLRVVRPSRAGIEALAVVDRNSRSPASSSPQAAKTTEVHLIVGCRLEPHRRHVGAGLSSRPNPLIPSVPASVARQAARRRAKCVLEWQDLVAYGERA